MHTETAEVIKELFEQASVKVVEGSSLSKALSQTTGYQLDASFIEAIVASMLLPVFSLNLQQYYWL